MIRTLFFLLALCVAAGAAAQQPAGKDAGKPAKKPTAAAKAKIRPAWAELTADQQMILAPLKADWESLEPERRRKWIGIAKRYPSMKLEEQERMQRRMHAWAKLSPEQRRLARENYKRIVKVPPERREKLRQEWAEYQALPPHERQSLVPPPEPPRGSKQ